MPRPEHIGPYPHPSPTLSLKLFVHTEQNEVSLRKNLLRALKSQYSWCGGLRPALRIRPLGAYTQ